MARPKDRLSDDVRDRIYMLIVSAMREGQAHPDHADYDWEFSADTEEDFDALAEAILDAIAAASEGANASVRRLTESLLDGRRLAAAFQLMPVPPDEV